MTSAPSATVKIKMIGDSGVGKTSIIYRYTENTFTENTQATIGVDYKNTTIKINENTVKLSIWDTAGQDKYRTLTSSYYKGAHAMCMVFAIDNRESFENLNKWLKEFHDNSGGNDSLVMLIANKIDIQDRVVTKDEAEQYAKKNSMIYTEVSAKTAKGIKDFFEEAANKVLENNPSLLQGGSNKKGTKLTQENSNSGEGGICC